MENSFQTSFIPKKPITTNPSVSRPTRGPTSILTVIGFLLLIVVGICAGGLYLYKNYLLKQKDTLSFSLTKVRETFEKDTLDELELYDKRVSAAGVVLGKHIVLSPMLKLLGDLTIPSIQYTNFSQDMNAQGFTVNLTGLSPDYRSIALQADSFNSAKGRSFKNVVFSNLNKDKNNNVSFNVQFTVDPSILSYEKNVLLENAQAKASPALQKENVEVNTPSQNIVLPPMGESFNNSEAPAASLEETPLPESGTLPSGQQ